MPLHWVAAPDYLDDPEQQLKLALFPNGCAVRKAGLAALEQIERPWHPLHKPVQHPLLPGLVEIDGELVAFDGDDVAVAEFQVEDAVADREGRRGVGDGFGDEFALDDAAAHRFAAGAVAARIVSP
jgi:hypothetical protein